MCTVVRATEHSVADDKGNLYRERRRSLPVLGIDIP